MYMCFCVDTLSTVGVDVGIWKYRKDLDSDPRKKKGGRSMRSVTFYTWDFGGQEEYYVTHQCFLSTRSLYLVVWSVKEGERGIEQLGPWLHNIQVHTMHACNTNMHVHACNTHMHVHHESMNI